MIINTLSTICSYLEMMKLDQLATKRSQFSPNVEWREYSTIPIPYTKQIQQTFSCLEVMPHFTTISDHH